MILHFSVWDVQDISWNSLLLVRKLSKGIGCDYRVLQNVDLWMEIGKRLESSIYKVHKNPTRGTLWDYGDQLRSTYIYSYKVSSHSAYNTWEENNAWYKAIWKWAIWISVQASFFHFKKETQLGHSLRLENRGETVHPLLRNKLCLQKLSYLIHLVLK